MELKAILLKGFQLRGLSSLLDVYNNLLNTKISAF